EYHRILRDSAGCSLLSLSESQDESRPVPQLPSDGGANPDSVLSESQFRDEVIAAIERLPEKEQMVLSLYYERELNLKEIGAVLGVTESRVCQIHGQALARLRAYVQR
ncbi:MAG: sigma-70 family RNA polymerase sigma factor, partial [Woeseiaceae bacterium]|nr:sigma-70 family RNA polymerase sigma factor [Woeseiaceae bacterium]